MDGSCPSSSTHRSTLLHVQSLDKCQFDRHDGPSAMGWLQPLRQRTADLCLLWRDTQSARLPLDMLHLPPPPPPLFPALKPNLITFRCADGQPRAHP